MLTPIEVVIVDYDPEWPVTAARLGERLRVLEPVLIDVHHIGSTSVPGLAAKPIIDLMPVVTDLARLDAERSHVEGLGFEWYGESGISRRRYCTLSDDAGTRIAQLHFFEDGSPEAERHIAFRDYLRAHPDVARAYEQEKRRARALYPTDSHAYTDEKATWIERWENVALDWYVRQ